MLQWHMLQESFHDPLNVILLICSSARVFVIKSFTLKVSHQVYM